MKSVLDWIEKKAIPFVEKWWLPVAVVVGAILAIMLGKKVFGPIVDAIFGKVNFSTFTPIPGDPQHVTVPTAHGPQVVKLPAGVTSSTPGLRVGYAPGYMAKVEVPDGAINRK
jgi:hypothetical protein